MKAWLKHVLRSVIHVDGLLGPVSVSLLSTAVVTKEGHFVHKSIIIKKHVSCAVDIFLTLSQVQVKVHVAIPRYEMTMIVKWCACSQTPSILSSYIQPITGRVE